ILSDLTMSIDNTPMHLRTAYEELETASELITTPDSKKKLAGTVIQLRYYVEGDPRDYEPEAQVRADPNSIETIKTHIADIATETDDEAIRNHLDQACAELDVVIETLSDGLRRQYRSF
ncbi:MAG TPA: hypothetical protein VE134_02620, partial [Methanomicrobiales archaeon]|nr:hypothetical protein [Methanomicrobiales archaeon]